jgi:hypothetical protein
MSASDGFASRNVGNKSDNVAKVTDTGSNYSYTAGLLIAFLRPEAASESR